jgi:lysophospholipase L1-like esterase
MAGWGQMLPGLVNENVEVRNHALCGRSSKSFFDEGQFEPVQQAMQEGDLLLIQFGHNDSKPDEERYTDPHMSYVSYLQHYVDTARHKGAFPVLVTPVQRRHFDRNGRLKDTHGEYPAAMMRLARSHKIPMLYLGERTRELLVSLGPSSSKCLFVWLEEGQHPNYPEGCEDDTHFNEDGACAVAELGARELRKLGKPFDKFVNRTVVRDRRFDKDRWKKKYAQSHDQNHHWK